MEPILDRVVEWFEHLPSDGRESPGEYDSGRESQSECEKDKESPTRPTKEALEMVKAMKKKLPEKIEQMSKEEQLLFVVEYEYDSGIEGQSEDENEKKTPTRRRKEALEVVKVMKQKLSETIEEMSVKEQLLYVYSIHSLRTALIQHSPEQLEHSPEVAKLAVLLLGMGRFHQFRYKERISDIFHSIVLALSFSLAHGQIPLVSNPHVKEAIQSMSIRAPQKSDQSTDYSDLKNFSSFKELYYSAVLSYLSAKSKPLFQGLVEESRDGHKSHSKYSEVAFLFNVIFDLDSDRNSTILSLQEVSFEKRETVSEHLKSVSGKMVRNVHQTGKYQSALTSLLVLPWKGAENHTPINIALNDKKPLNSKTLPDSKQKSLCKYVLPEKRSIWKCNKPESASSCALHANQNAVQDVAIVHRPEVYRPMMYQTGNQSNGMLPIARSNVYDFSSSPSCWKRRLNSIDHKNKVHYVRKVSVSQLEELDTECHETICHAVVSECTPEEASLLICVLQSRELNIFSQCDKYGNTPLHVAVLKNNQKAIDNLFEMYPAGIWIENQDGETPVDLAYRMHHIQIIRCLCNQLIKNDPHSPETSRLWISLLHRAKNDKWNDLQNILLELQVQWSLAIDPTSNDMQTQTLDARVAAVSNNSHCINLQIKQMEHDQRVASANNNVAQHPHETSLPAHPILHEDSTEYDNNQLNLAFLNDTDGNELHIPSQQEKIAIKQPHNSNDPTQTVATNTFASQNLPHFSEPQHEHPNVLNPKVTRALQLPPAFGVPSKESNPKTQSLQHLHDSLSHFFPSDEGSGYSEDDQRDTTKIKRSSHLDRSRRKFRQASFAFRSVGSGSSSSAYSSSDQKEFPNSQKQKKKRKVAMDRIQRGRMSASDSEYKWRKVKRRTRQRKTVTRMETTPVSSTDSSIGLKSLIPQSCSDCRKESAISEIVKDKEGVPSPSSIETHSAETHNSETNSSETPFSASHSSHLYAHPSECNADSMPQREKKSKLLLPSLPDSSHFKDKIEKLQTAEHEHIEENIITPRDISQSKPPISTTHTGVFSSPKTQSLQSMSKQSEDELWKCSSQPMIKSPEDIVSFAHHLCCSTMLKGYPITTEKELDQREIYPEEKSSDSHFNFELKIEQHSFASLCFTRLQKPCLKMWDGSFRISTITKLSITVNDLKWFQSLMQATFMSKIKHFRLPIDLTCSSNAYTPAVNDKQQLLETKQKKKSEDKQLQFGNRVVSDLQVCLKQTALPCASCDKISHCQFHCSATSTLIPMNRAKLTDVCEKDLQSNSCDNLSSIEVVQLQPLCTFCMLEQHKAALTTHTGNIRFLPKKQKKRFEVQLSNVMWLQFMKQAAFVSRLSVHWIKVLNVNISTPEAIQVNFVTADVQDKPLVQKQSSLSHFKAALTTIIHDTEYNKIKELVPNSLHFLFGFSPWSGQRLSKFLERRYRIILKVARCHRSAIPADVKPNLDDLANVFKQRWEQRPSVKRSVDRGGGGDKKSKLSLKKSSKQLKNTPKDGVVSHGVDPNETAESGVFSSLEPKSKGAVPKPFSGYKNLPSAATASEPDKQRRHSQKSRINTQERKQLIKSPSEAEREENVIMPSTLHFDNSNNPLEVIRGHFTTFKKCCQRHDIQHIVVVGTTYPASEALGPKRKHSSINDLRKEDRHTHFSFSSSLCRKGSSGTWKPLPLQLPLLQTDVLDKDGSIAAKKMSSEHPMNYPQRQGDKDSSQNLLEKDEVVKKDCSMESSKMFKTSEHSVNNPRKQHYKDGPRNLLGNDEVEKDSPMGPRKMPTRSAEIGEKMMKGGSLAAEQNEELLRTTHASPPAEKDGGNLTCWNLGNSTVNQPSIQPLSSSNRPSVLPLSSSIQHDKWMHLLSDSQKQFHEERITTIAELIHAQDYPRILPLSYWGNPPPNLPPKYLIAYIFSTALSYYKMGSNKESLVHFQMSLNQAEAFGRKGDVTLSCVYIGDIEFSQRKFIEAAKQYQTALKNYSRESVARCFRMVLPSQSALCAKHGSALKNATKVVDAISAYELAIAKAESKKDKLSAHTSLGNLLQSLGENSRAITEYETSIELATALKDYVSLGWAYGNMGNAFLGLYQREKALHHLEKSLDLTVEHEPIPQAIGRAYNNLGTAHQALNELDKAEEFYDLALGQAIYGNDIPGQARVYGNIGNLLMLKKECDRAVPHYTEVLRLSQDRSTVSTAHHNRGCAYYEWAETKKETFLNKDRDIMPMAASPDTNIKPLLHGPQFEQCEREYRPPFIPENIKKYYTQATKDLDYVIRHHEESLDSIKGSAKGLSLSVSLFESNSRTFHRKQDCLVSTGNFEEALLAAEQSRARTLGELLLKRRGPQLEHQLRSPPSLEQLKLIVALQNSPVVYLSYTGARLLGWLFYPTPDQPSLNMFEVPLNDDEFDGKSFDYHLRYSLNEVLVEKSFEMYTPFKSELSQNDLVRKLYDLVAQPLMVMLQKLKKDTESQEQPQKRTQKVIVIPDSYTNLLPLTCLLNKDGKFWGDDHYFQIMPSLLTMGILDQLPTVSVTVPVENQQMLCVVGNPTIPIFTYNNEEWNLGKLPHATREAEWVSHILNCTPILHEQATKTAVMMRIMNAKVIHLATHGSASAGFLAFAGMTTSFGSPIESQNVLIYPEEIEKLNITPALVVLSSCDSGRGIVKADGIQGMARAFILAGAQAVLTTLWRVPDESACIFMQFFYQYLVDGLKGTEALHKSILSVRCFSKYSQYIHWSGYQLTGREIQFSINRSSSAADLTVRLGNHSIFPQLEIVKQLETTFLKNPRLPTDVQVRYIFYIYHIHSCIK